MGEAKGASASGEPSGCSAADDARGPLRDVARPPGGESANVDRRAFCIGTSKVKIATMRFRKERRRTCRWLCRHFLQGSNGKASRCCTVCQSSRKRLESSAMHFAAEAH